MTTATHNSDPSNPSVANYVVLGLATCFIREDSDLHPVTVVEPIPSASMETLVQGIPTSYTWAIATTTDAILLDDQPQLLPDFPPETQFCDDFMIRLQAAARTYQSKPSAQALLALGETRSDFNHSIERKRVLNSERIVKAEDNVKQHSYTHQVL